MTDRTDQACAQSGMPNIEDHRAAAERMLGDAVLWTAQAEEPTPEAGELICLAYSITHALLAIHDTLTASDRYAANEAKQREELLEDAWQFRDWEAVSRLQDEEREAATTDNLSDPGHWERIVSTAKSSTGIFTVETLATTVDVCRALIDVRDRPALSDRYAANEAKQREEAEPDPLDENDHRDRLDAGGIRWTRAADGCWAHAAHHVLELISLPGPLAFAPNTTRKDS